MIYRKKDIKDACRIGHVNEIDIIIKFLESGQTLDDLETYLLVRKETLKRTV